MINVIIVDDEVISRVGIRNLLDWETEGFNLLATCENGKEALDFIKSNHVDIVLTDIKMPIMDGLELIKSAHEKGFNCKFILLSAFDDFVYVRQALTLGAIDYLRKLELNQTVLLETLDRAKSHITKTTQRDRSGDHIDVKKSHLVKKQF